MWKKCWLLSHLMKRQTSSTSYYTTMIFKTPYAYARGLQGSGTTATEMFPKLKDQSMQQSSSRELIQGSLFYFILFYFLRHKKRYKDLESLSSCYESLKFAANKMQLNLPTIVKKSWYLLARWLPIQQQVCTTTTSLHSTWGVVLSMVWAWFCASLLCTELSKKKLLCLNTPSLRRSEEECFPGWSCVQLSLKLKFNSTDTHCLMSKTTPGYCCSHQLLSCSNEATACLNRRLSKRSLGTWVNSKVSITL